MAVKYKFIEVPVAEPEDNKYLVPDEKDGWEPMGITYKTEVYMGFGASTRAYMIWRCRIVDPIPYEGPVTKST